MFFPSAVVDRGGRVTSALTNGLSLSWLAPKNLPSEAQAPLNALLRLVISLYNEVRAYASCGLIFWEVSVSFDLVEQYLLKCVYQ